MGGGGYSLFIHVLRQLYYNIAVQSRVLSSDRSPLRRFSDHSHHLQNNLLTCQFVIPPHSVVPPSYLYKIKYRYVQTDRPEKSLETLQIHPDSYEHGVLVFFIVEKAHRLNAVHSLASFYFYLIALQHS